MSNLTITISDAVWEQTLDYAKQNPGTEWCCIGDNGHILAEGRITHIPFIHKSQWEPTARIFVGRGEIGEPICVGFIRSIVKLP